MKNKLIYALLASTLAVLFSLEVGAFMLGGAPRLWTGYYIADGKDPKVLMEGITIKAADIIAAKDYVINTADRAADDPRVQAIAGNDFFTATLSGGMELAGMWGEKALLEAGKGGLSAAGNVVVGIGANFPADDAGAVIAHISAGDTQAAVEKYTRGFIGLLAAYTAATGVNGAFVATAPAWVPVAAGVAAGAAASYVVKYAYDSLMEWAKQEPPPTRTILRRPAALSTNTSPSEKAGRKFSDLSPAERQDFLDCVCACSSQFSGSNTYDPTADIWFLPGLWGPCVWWGNSVRFKIVMPADLNTHNMKECFAKYDLSTDPVALEQTFREILALNIQPGSGSAPAPSPGDNSVGQVLPKPGMGGVVQLEAVLAKFRGQGGVSLPKVEHDPPNIGYWTDARAVVEWQFKLPQAGHYRVEMNTASIGDSRMKVELNGGAYDVFCPRTGDYGIYKVQDLGLLSLPAGEQALRIVPDAKSWSPINVRWVRLTRVN